MFIHCSIVLVKPDPIRMFYLLHPYLTVHVKVEFQVWIKLQFRPLLVCKITFTL